MYRPQASFYFSFISSYFLLSACTENARFYCLFLQSCLTCFKGMERNHFLFCGEHERISRIHIFKFSWVRYISLYFLGHTISFMVHIVSYCISKWKALLWMVDIFSVYCVFIFSSTWHNNQQDHIVLMVLPS